MKEIFVVSDIHGHLKEFEKLLTFWDKQSTLVILGDLIDRGPQSLEVIRKIMSLKQQYGEQVIICKGNHESMLLDFIEEPEKNQAHYYKYGGRETMDSFLNYLPDDIKELHPIDQAYIVKDQFINELTFLKDSKPYEIIGNVLLTHAGFDSDVGVFEEMTERDFLWVRQHYLNENPTPYINVFGHTPLKYIHDSNEIWMSDDKKYIGIDGGCYFTGQLNGILISEDGQLLRRFYVTSKETEKVEIN